MKLSWKQYRLLCMSLLQRITAKKYRKTRATDADTAMQMQASACAACMHDR